jgi:6-pyruvoyltetrahydropterin/6-carboxytetrahydropterin synthase
MSPKFRIVSPRNSGLKERRRMYEIYSEAGFSGAHLLRDYEGPCESLHGHNWRVRVCVGAEALNDAGMVVDFKILKQAMETAAARLDHKYLNDIPPFDSINPSAENIAHWFYDEVSKRIETARARVTRVMVWESDRSCATYTP